MTLSEAEVLPATSIVIPKDETAVATEESRELKLRCDRGHFGIGHRCS